MATLAELQQRARSSVDLALHDPEKRYLLRAEFYRKYGGSPDMGASELAFLRWEIGRGVLNALDAPRPGSPWWRAVNEAVLYAGALAALIHEAGLDDSASGVLEGLDWPVRCWLRFIQSPSASTWYRAHNSSVIAAYLANTEAALSESQAERTFMNIVLYRLLFAQAMVEGKAYAFGPLGRVLANPPDPAVDALVHLPDFYPDHYPLSPQDIRHILDRGHSLEEAGVVFLDDGLIIPHLKELYAAASGWNGEPELPLLLERGGPCYPRKATRKKVAILGGGVGAITAAFALTDPANPDAELYDVTLYQIGWRLGGKGASGRSLDPDKGFRIHEHGLHIWFGCYDNAFRSMRRCYGELAEPSLLTGEPLRAPDAPLANWQEAFRPQGAAFLVGRFNRIWHTWYSQMPANHAIPGDGDLLPLSECFRMAMQVLFGLFKARPLPGLDTTGVLDIQFPQGAAAVLASLASRLETSAWKLLERIVEGNHALARLLDEEGALAMKVVSRLMEIEWASVQGQIDHDYDVESRWATMNFIFASLRGFFEDRLVERGIDSINHLEYRDWLRRHAFPDGDRMVNSTFVQGIYDGSFAYVDGDNTMPPGAGFPLKANMEAGTTMRAGLRMYLAYKGGPVWKMQAGMGDVVFGPYYQVLKRRGVKFKFFHRVRELVPTADKTGIASIRVGRQVTLKNGPAEAYEPLLNVKGLPCWPAEPLYDQLVEGAELKARKIDLESYVADWPDREEITLKAGEDFDAVILGISLGAIPYICPQLIEASPPWKKMVDEIKTIRTQGVQVWLKKTTSQLGWNPMLEPVVSGFDYRDALNPLETWGDMTHLIEREAWPNDSYPMSIAYFCSSFSDSASPGQDQAAANAAVKRNARDLLEKRISALLPKTRDRHGQGFDWDLLVGDFDSQYFIGNVKPSERYVLTVAGSSKYRLPAHDRQFGNLYLAGDWIQCHLNYGCVEAATMGGLFAANALSGYPAREDIIGLEW